LESVRAFAAEAFMRMEAGFRDGVVMQALPEPSCCQLYRHGLWPPSRSWGGALGGCLQGRARRGEEEFNKSSISDIEFND
jgi:hypothetical protein